MNNWDSLRIEQIRDNTAKMADAFTRIADALERLTDRKTEPTISKMEQVEEPMKTTDYCDICKRDMCEACVADATNPYCVPSHYEINYEPKDEPQTEIHIDEPRGYTLKTDTDCAWK